jgi:hypothetical protein
VRRRWRLIFQAFSVFDVHGICHDPRMEKPRRLQDAYRFPGFEPENTVRGIFGDPKARLLRLRRLRKKPPAESVDNAREASTTASSDVSATSPVATPESTWKSRFGASTVDGVLP